MAKILECVQNSDGSYTVKYESGKTFNFKKINKSISAFLGLDKKEEKPKKQKFSRKCPRGFVLGFIIYPDNSEQMNFFQYLLKREKLVYIYHFGETPALVWYPLGEQYNDCLYDEGHDIKPHYHCMILFDYQHTVQGFLKSSGGCLKHAEPISDRKAYARYMIHDTYLSLKEGKRQYKIEDLKTTNNDFLCSCLVSDKVNSQVGAMGEIVGIIEEHGITNFPELLSVIRSLYPKPELLSLILNKSAFFGAYLRDLRYAYKYQK